jgi:hypothetical protein
MLRRTVSVPASRSMSFHCSARASDWRSPSARATVQRAELRTPAAASRTARASPRSRAVATSLGRWAGGSTRVAMLRGTSPRWTATVRARDRMPVMARHGGRGVAVGQQGGVELVEVFGPEPADPVASDAGDQVLSDGRFVALQGPPADAARRDGGQPVLEPPGDGRGGRLADGAGVALTFELSDLRHHDVAARAADVPPVGPDVEPEAHGDVTLPAPVGALVDRRLAVRRTSRSTAPRAGVLNPQSSEGL